MTLVLNGTTGVSAVDGSAATPAIQGNDSNTGIFFPAADTIAFAEGGAEVARFDSSGNLLVGTTSASYSATNRGVVNISGSSGGLLSLISGSNKSYLFQSGADLLIENDTASGAMIFGTNSSTERARIASDGVFTFKGGSADLVLQATSTSRYWNHNKATSEGAGFTYYVFQHGGSGVGSITYNGSGVSYNTTSDYRLKEDIQPMAGALAKVAALKPCTYKWKADGFDGQGFIAHELQAVMPDCVTGAKDAVDADGNPIYQGIDTSFLVATLTAAIQELRGIVDSQAARIAALEGAAS